MIREIPSAWDETRVLPPSKIGELAVFARRKGTMWFLACMNGDHPQAFDVSLRFLENGRWDAKVVSDVEGKAAAASVARRTFSADGRVRIELSPGGGYVAEFDRAP